MEEQKARQNVQKTRMEEREAGHMCRKVEWKKGRPS
jgi:hypothetical protein